MYCISIGQIPGQIPTRVEVWRNVKCQKWGGGGCIWFIDLNSLVRGGNSSNIWHIWFFLKQFDPKSSTVLSNVSLSVGAPVRVYLHSLVRRLLYSHLTPSTLSSPSLPPSSVLQCTPILTLPLLLPHCSMGEYVWCYDQCMSAACPDKLLRLSLSSLFFLGQLRLGDAPDAPPLENDHTCRGSQMSWGWQGTVHTHSYL